MTHGQFRTLHGCWTAQNTDWVSLLISHTPVFFTKASEASWSYSCDSKVSFDRVQILTPDFSGRSPPPPSLPLPTSPLLSSSLSPCLLVFLPPSLPPPSSQVRLRPVVALWHVVSVAYLAAALAHSHSHSHSLSLSHPHCLSHLSHLSHLSLISQLSLISLSSLSHLSHLSLISFSSLSYLSHLSLLSLSLSPLCLSSFRLSSLSSLAGGSGQRTTYKGLFTPASKKSAVFFPTSLPSTFPFWSASFRPPPVASSLCSKWAACRST